ncbi:adenylate/guanylate cyclase domain-containing protein [Candidatus Riflebacteria bacterium]
MGLFDFGKKQDDGQISALKAEILKLKDELQHESTIFKTEKSKLQKKLQDLQLSSNALVSNIKILTQSTKREEIFELFWKTLDTNVDITECHLLEYQPEGNNFRVLLEKLPQGKQSLLQEIIPHDEDSLVSWVFSKGMMITPAYCKTDPQVDALVGRGILKDAKLIFPVKSEGKTSLVLSISSCEKSDLEEKNRITLLNFLCSLLGLTMTNAMLLEKIEAENKRRMKQLARYHSKEEMENILSQGEEVQNLGESKEITVFFVDIRGFTSISESLTAVKVVKLLDLYLDRLSVIIMESGGAIDKFVGDEIMALFGLTQKEKSELDLYAAVDAALSCCAHTEPLNKKLAENGLPPIEFGIGVHKGVAVVGDIGSDVRRDFTAIGDTVNVAARLCSEAKGRTVVISETSAKRLHPFYTMKSLGTVNLKGKAEPMKIFQVGKPSDKFNRCPACKMFSKKGEKFCGNCGEKLDHA